MIDTELRAMLAQYWIDADYDTYCEFLETLHTCPTREETEFYKGMDLDEYEF